VMVFPTDRSAMIGLRFYEAIGGQWAVLTGRATQREIVLANIDDLIPATALSMTGHLVTRNMRDFAGVEVQLFNLGNLNRGSSRAAPCRSRFRKRTYRVKGFRYNRLSLV